MLKNGNSLRMAIPSFEDFIVRTGQIFHNFFFNINLAYCVFSSILLEFLPIKKTVTYRKQYLLSGGEICYVSLLRLI